jgi:subtilisin family serine protease
MPDIRRTLRGIAPVLVGAAVGLAVLPIAGSATPSGIYGVAAPNRIPGSYIVVLKDTATVASSAANLTARHGGTVKLTYTAALRGFAVSATEEQAARLAADPAVAYVEQDSIARAVDTQPNPPSYGLDRIDQRNLPLDNSYTFANRAPSVNAFIVDTGGRFTHTEFGGRLRSGRDFIDNDNDSTDCNGHGTHVAGTVGAAAYGVAKNVNLTAVRVLDCGGSGPFSGVIAGIDWVVQNGARPAVINMSLAGGATSSVDDAVARATQAGVHVVVAAGNNSGQDACNFSPARAPSAITVGATDRNDARASFSNIGRCLDIFAPGVSIPSTWFSGDNATNTISGTSMASPHVAGGLALFLETNRNATPQQARDALVGNATDGKVTNPGANSPNKLLFVGGAPPTCGTQTNTTDVSIPDAGAAVTSPIDVSGCEGRAPATLSVRVDINHTYTADLAVELIGPSGAVYTLRKPGGIGESGGIHAGFTVDASAENANGRWQLRVQDTLRFDTGVLDSWAIF